MKNILNNMNTFFNRVVQYVTSPDK